MLVKKRNVVLVYCFSLFLHINLTPSFNKADDYLSFSSYQTDNSTPKIHIRQASNTHFEFQIDVPGALITKLKVQDSEYHLVTIPGCGHIDEIGQPILPEIIIPIAIPLSCTIADISIQVLSKKSIIYKDYDIPPVPRRNEERTLDGLSLFKKKFIKDEKTYSTDGFYPDDIVKIKNIGFIRDQKVMWLTLCPIQTNPVTGELKAFHQLRVKITHDGGQIFCESGLGPWTESKDDLFCNPVPPSESVYPRSRNEGRVTFPTDLYDEGNNADYLVISSDALLTNTALDSLARHRATFNGFHVAMVKANDIYHQFPDTSDDASLRNFLVYAYNYWQAPYFKDNHLGYVLLVGEGNEHSTHSIPAHFYTNTYYGAAKSDFWYSCVNDDNGDGVINDRDLISDIMVGRFSVEDHRELNTIARKTIHYELGLDSDEDWRRQVSLISGFLSDNNPDVLFHTLEGFVDNQNFYKISEVLNRSMMAPQYVKTSFIQAINEGRAIVNIQAHGGVDTWGDGQGWHLFTSDDVVHLHNDGKLSIALSFACQTACFYDEEKDCLGEVLLNQSDRGAVAFVGATVGVDFDANVILNRNLFNNLLKRESIDLGVSFYISRFMGNPNPYYNLLGDPALRFDIDGHRTLADLTVTPEDVFVEWSPFMGYPEKVKVSVRNFGTDEASFIKVQLFSQYPKIGDQQIGEDIVIDSISGMGGCETVEVTIEDVAEGMIPLYVKVDPDNTIPEMNERNNTAFLLARESLYHDMSTTAGLTDSGSGRAAAFGDYNNDGYLDLFVYNNNNSSHIYKNNKDGSFLKANLPSEISSSDSAPGTTFIDYDNDGCLDIFVSGGKSEGHFFYHNKGDDTFEQIPVVTNDEEPLIENPVGFFDYDGDGFLDMVCIEEPEGQNILYRSDGDGSFSDVTRGTGLDTTWGCEYAAFGDYDNDGHLDILVLRKSPFPHTLFKNRGDGHFTDMSEIAGIGYTADSKWTTFGDYNHDGFLDIFIYNDSTSNILLRNNRDGTFRDVALAAGVDDIRADGIGTFLDVDNDGYIDLFFESNGFCFFRNQGYHTFKEEPFVFVENRNVRIWNVAFGDYDNDGNIDLYGIFTPADQNVNAVNSSGCLYRNSGGGNHWLIVMTRGMESNSFGIGTRVRAVTGNRTQIREVTCSVDNRLQNSLPLEFGLGEYDRVDTLEVRWPSGKRNILTSIRANRIVTVLEGWGDFSALSSYQLFHNYPNPFNGTTTIRYVLKINPHDRIHAKQVNISIFNMLGEKIRCIVEGIITPGHYSVLWDGKDDYGRQLPSGVYIYRLEAGEFVESKKMILLR